VRTVLGLAREALEACPVGAAKAVVGTLEKALELVQVSHRAYFVPCLSDERHLQDEEGERWRAGRAGDHSRENPAYHTILRMLRLAKVGQHRDSS
jgi:hypothetical protein